MVSKNHDLKDIQLGECRLLTDVILIAIADNCHQLRKITLCSDLITDRGIKMLVSSNHDLEEITVHCCPKLTDATLTAITDNCPKLKKLVYVASTNITESGIRSIREKYPGHTVYFRPS